MQVLVHGGAGGTPHEPDARQSVVDDAARRGSACANPVSAVLQSVQHLEDSPRFNAGVGSAPQSDGTIRTDAGIMVNDGSIGAACGMSGVAHALRVAEAVRTETPHTLMVGDPVVHFAESMGISTGVDLWTERTRERWIESDFPGSNALEQRQLVCERFGKGCDTVGAVAIADGRLVAGTSTGGRRFALAGRVGDVPQPGAGFYVNDAAAASATGDGEEIARLGLTRAAVDAVDDGQCVSDAADEAIAQFDAQAEGSAGLVMLDRNGNLGVAYSSESMQTACATDGSLESEKSQ